MSRVIATAITVMTTTNLLRIALRLVPKPNSKATRLEKLITARGGRFVGLDIVRNKEWFKMCKEKVSLSHLRSKRTHGVRLSHQASK
jgi:hypothetical protein